MSRHRRPAWVYAQGEEPDYRWSFANERTYLAWIRTAVALIAAGYALDTLNLLTDNTANALVAGMLLSLGLVCAVVSWPRWAAAERAMRRREPLPPHRLGRLLGVLVGLVAVVLLATMM